VRVDTPICPPLGSTVSNSLTRLDVKGCPVRPEIRRRSLTIARIVAIHAPKHLSAASKRPYRRLVADYDQEREPRALETLR
jgi:hypothetical protein